MFYNNRSKFIYFKSNLKQMKLWQKEKTSVSEKIEAFTIGDDAKWDLELAEFDVLGSLAHIKMLTSIGLLEKNELETLSDELKNIYQEVKSEDFKIASGIEDIHSQVELMLTDRLGEVGKKIHSGRSRNDQVLVDLKLYMRSQIKEMVGYIQLFFDKLTELSEKYKDILIPGYTHLQVAMPSSLGLWFGAYAESLLDDMQMMLASYKVVNKNPLGSAAGYGSSFPLDRTMTTDLLGFENLNYNVVYAQMSRGKSEKLVSMAMASVASTLARLSMDVCLYMNQNFNFISFPDELTTGSSIMPHKKNPDVFELIRGKCNALQALPNQVSIMTTNLPSGYHREMQLIKEQFFPAFNTLNDCLEMGTFMLDNMIVKDNILDDDKYKYLFSVELVNQYVLEGMPFRDAYKKVGDEINNGEFNPEKKINHTHEGSIGNLCTKEIQNAFTEVVDNFEFDKFEDKINHLLK